nr:hypothetical protein Iba_chr14dCG8770 [Ipomoea batatas]
MGLRLVRLDKWETANNRERDNVLEQFVVSLQPSPTPSPNTSERPRLSSRTPHHRHRHRRVRPAAQSLSSPTVSSFAVDQFAHRLLLRRRRPVRRFTHRRRPPSPPSPPVCPPGVNVGLAFVDTAIVVFALAQLGFDDYWFIIDAKCTSNLRFMFLPDGNFLGHCILDVLLCLVGLQMKDALLVTKKSRASDQIRDTAELLVLMSSKYYDGSCHLCPDAISFMDRNAMLQKKEIYFMSLDAIQDL